MKTEFSTTCGFDYGGGTANKDSKTGIRFGVISPNDVGERWYDEAEPRYADDGEGEACGYIYVAKGYQAAQSVERDIFVVQSPYFTYAAFCSPCAPGACYLMKPLDPEVQNENNKAYCFGHEWFNDGEAPYPVYSVATGELIQPTKKGN